MTQHWVYGVGITEWQEFRQQPCEWHVGINTPRARDVRQGDVVIITREGTASALAVTHVLAATNPAKETSGTRAITLRPDLVTGNTAGAECEPLQPYVWASTQSLWQPCLITGDTAAEVLAYVRAALTHTVCAPAGLTAEDVRWAYKVLLDRWPENETVVTEKLSACGTMSALRRDLLASDEFRQRHFDLHMLGSSTIVIKELPTGGRLWVDANDQAIGLPILQGAYEPDEIAYVMRHVKPGMRVVDLGANIGYYTIIMARLVEPHGHVYAFEPLPRNLDLLRKSVQENKFQRRIDIHECAAGMRCGAAKLLTPQHTTNWGGAYIIHKGQSRAARHDVLNITVKTLDSCAFTHKISFIKADIEGAELLALRGAEQLLRRDRPVVMCECNPPQLQQVSQASPEALIEWMTSLQYRVSILAGGSLTTVDPAALAGRITTLVCEPQ